MKKTKSDVKIPEGNDMNREEIMAQWDHWRAEIANGHKGSAPRDWFESVLNHYEEQIEEITIFTKELKRWKPTSIGQGPRTTANY